MIAINWSYDREKTNVLVLVPYYQHSTVKGLLEDIDLDKNRIFGYLFNEQPVPDEEVLQRENLEREYKTPFVERRKDFRIPLSRERFYIDDLLRIIGIENIDAVIPTKESQVSMLVKYSDEFKGKLFLPSEGVVELLQNKADSYDFFNRYGVRTPDFFRLGVGNFSELEKRLKNEKSFFIKPSCSSGGKFSYEVSSTDQFLELFNGVEGELIASEVLNLPEYNHTMLIHEGEVQVHATYECPGSTRFGETPRKIVNDSRIDGLAKQICSILCDEYGVRSVEGVYNIDFLTDNRGDYVFTEINVGRLPGGHSIFTSEGLNLSEAVVDLTLNTDLVLNR